MLWFCVSVSKNIQKYVHNVWIETHFFLRESSRYWRHEFGNIHVLNLLLLWMRLRLWLRLRIVRKSTIRSVKFEANQKEIHGTSYKLFYTFDKMFTILAWLFSKSHCLFMMRKGGRSVGCFFLQKLCGSISADWVGVLRGLKVHHQCFHCSVRWFTNHFLLFHLLYPITPYEGGLSCE